MEDLVGEGFVVEFPHVSEEQSWSTFNSAAVGLRNGSWLRLWGAPKGRQTGGLETYARKQGWSRKPLVLYFGAEKKRIWLWGQKGVAAPRRLATQF